METNNDSPNPIREDDWDEAAEENYPQELTEVLQAADVAEQLEQAQEEEYTPDWDGTDAEFVEDEDAAEYEEQYAGIKGQWEIPLDGTSSFEEFDDLMVLFTPKNAILAMPMRAMEPAVIADIQGMLIAGCIPEKR